MGRLGAPGGGSGQWLFYQPICHYFYTLITSLAAPWAAAKYWCHVVVYSHQPWVAPTLKAARVRYVEHLGVHLTGVCCVTVQKALVSTQLHVMGTGSTKFKQLVQP